MSHCRCHVSKLLASGDFTALFAPASEDSIVVRTRRSEGNRPLSDSDLLGRSAAHSQGFDWLAADDHSGQRQRHPRQQTFTDKIDDGEQDHRQSLANEEFDEVLASLI